MPSPHCSGGEISQGDTAWLLVSFLLVLSMMPGLAMFEAGLLRSKNTLSIISQIVTGIVTNSVLWVIMGFSLSFGPGTNPVLGNFDHALFIGVSSSDCSVHAPTVPQSAYAMFQMMFAVITPLLMTGAYAERLRFQMFVPFNMLWEIIVYYPLAHWIFSSAGWLKTMGAQDFAGGIVIHTSAGIGSLVTAHLLGPREEFEEYEGEFPPSNVPLAAIGTAMLWTGWFGFNAGSALSAGSVAAAAVTNTQLAACTCGLITLLLRWWHHKPSTVGVLNGAIGGLAGITPAAGYVDPLSALVLGVIFGVCCFYAGEMLKRRFRVDDALDVSVLHGFSGMLGSIAIGFCGDKAINADGENGIFHGGRGHLLGVQLLAVVITVLWAGFWTFAIFRGLQLCGFTARASYDEEEKGMDLTDHGETAYHDLVLDLEMLKSDLPKHFRATSSKLNTPIGSASGPLYGAVGSTTDTPNANGGGSAESLPMFFSAKLKQKHIERLKRERERAVVLEDAKEDEDDED